MAFARPHVVAISGSLNRPSKSRTLADKIAAAAVARVDLRLSSFDVLDAGPGLGAAFSRSQLSSEALAIVEAIEDADALIAVSPVYKGSYTGLFKHLFDFVSPTALINKPVVIGATGGGHRHGLVVEHQLRPLFGFFSALTVPTSVYASDHEFSEGQPVDPTVLDRIDLSGAQLGSLLLSRRTGTISHREHAIPAASAA
jgi:FMN reductase